jgi:hypothetical protein
MIQAGYLANAPKSSKERKEIRCNRNIESTGRAKRQVLMHQARIMLVSTEVVENRGRKLTITSGVGYSKAPPFGLTGSEASIHLTLLVRTTNQAPLITSEETQKETLTCV